MPSKSSDAGTMFGKPVDQHASHRNCMTCGSVFAWNNQSELVMSGKIDVRKCPDCQDTDDE